MCNLPKRVTEPNPYITKQKYSYAPSVRCPLEINRCSKQITEYPEGTEVVWCCDDNCTNPNGQLKSIEQREANILKGAKTK
jgi:hypothetical protein